MQPILIGSASEKETLRSNFPEDFECLMTATTSFSVEAEDEVVSRVFFDPVVVRRLEDFWILWLSLCPKFKLGKCRKNLLSSMSTDLYVHDYFLMNQLSFYVLSH